MCVGGIFRDGEWVVCLASWNLSSSVCHGWHHYMEAGDKEVAGH